MPVLTDLPATNTETTKTRAKCFDFYGIVALVTCSDGAVLHRVGEDFSYFWRGDRAVGEARCDIAIDAHLRCFDYNELPPIRATVLSPRNICFTDGDITYIDYFGEALSIYNRARNTLEIYSDRPHLLHEIIYLSLLSRVGERLERRGLHRVHALAIERHDECALFLLPSGGGKTTIALGLLREGTPYRLVSEDSPLITRTGRVRPFPLRLGVVARERPDVAPEHVTYVERMEFEPKYLVSLGAFTGRIAQGDVLPRMIFIGERTLAPNCVVRRAGRFRGLKALLRHMVVGVGLYQGIEFLLRTSILDLLRYGGLFLSRLVAGMAMLGRADVFVIQLGRVPRENLAQIAAFLQAEGLGTVRRTERHPASGDSA